MKDWETPDEDPRELLPRFRLLYIIIGLIAAIMFTRLWFLQIVEGDELRAYSEKNRVKENKIPAPRGLILDREGRILVDNITGFYAAIAPQYATRLPETAEEVGKILQLSPETIVAKVKQSRRKNGPFFPAVIKDNLNLDEVFRLKRIRIDHPGLNVTESVLRYYPLAENGAQLFGYVGEVSRHQLERFNREGKYSFNQGDIIGHSGLEKVWDSTIRGKDGLSFIEVDAHGREAPTQNKAFLEVKPERPTPGKNLVLTLDRDIQEAAYKAMLEQNDKIGPRIGGLVAMKTNGEILAWVSTPSFNPNPFAHGTASDVWNELKDHPFKPLRNKVIQDHYAPGSTIKPIIAAAALQEGVVNAHTIINAPGQMRFGNRSYHDSIRHGHGDINIIQALERSSNIFFYKMGIQLGIDTMAKYASLFHLGKKTEIMVPNEVAGVFPTKEWKLKVIGEIWQPGENLSNAIGQGFVLVNLLQMAMAYNSIGTNGKLYRPFVVKKMLNEQNEIIKEFEPELIRDITVASGDEAFIEAKHLKTIREGLRRVANGERGTARWWKIKGVQYAGKTGTSQVMSFSADDIYKKCETRPINQRHHGSFVAFAPPENPVITVAALTEHSCHGNTGSTPVVRDVIRAYFAKYHPETINIEVKEPQPHVEPVEEVFE